MAPHPALAVHGALARGVFAVVVLVSLAVLFAPASDVPSAPAGVDKLVHLGLFAALAASGRWAGVGVRVLVVLLLGYAAVSEVVQGLSALDRSMSAGDWVADAFGVLLGLALWELGARRSPARR
ncbi:VanZ family protein [Blastococcus sp. TF02-09]|uniref:VanZ family protein n=1 Tax=Blastococcus sp. TF02-09 TaxID=2250576 RepID=UPI0018F375E9|nr:VanZ family protein [Blastococcus sp. TF02-9]